VILAHGNSPLAVAMSLLDQGSVVKVQFLAKKSDLLADCTKATLGRICLLTFSLLAFLLGMDSLLSAKMVKTVHSINNFRIPLRYAAKPK
jgi:hypothetical protein